MRSTYPIHSYCSLRGYQYDSMFNLRTLTHRIAVAVAGPACSRSLRRSYSERMDSRPSCVLQLLRELAESEVYLGMRKYCNLRMKRTLYHSTRLMSIAMRWTLYPTPTGGTDGGVDVAALAVSRTAYVRSRLRLHSPDLTSAFVREAHRH